MGITISGATGIDMGDKPISNVSIDNQASVVDKAYVDDLKIIATGTATFTATTNNINLTGIGIGVEIGDVIQISGADDTKNNSEFTVEVITDANNIIVNQAHANKGTTKNVAARSGDTGVTVKLLAKWYNAPIGLGQDWVDMTGTILAGITYSNNIKRPIEISALANIVVSSAIYINVNGSTRARSQGSGNIAATPRSISLIIPIGQTYSITVDGTSLSAVYALR